MTERVSKILSDPRKIEADWKQHFDDMIDSGTTVPAEAAESMLRIAALIVEEMFGPRKTAAILTLAAMFFTQRIPKKGDLKSSVDNFATSYREH